MLKFCIFLVAINVALTQLSINGKNSIKYQRDQRKDLDDNVESNLKLINHYIGPFYTPTREQCWDKCKNESECVAISFCKDCKGACFMYKSGEYGVTRNDKYVSIAKEGKNLKNQPLVTLHYNIRLTNPLQEPFYNISTGDQCWGKCLNESGCVAVSFCEYCNGECSLFKNGNSSVIQNSDYITLAYESEIFASKPTYEYPGKKFWNDPFKGPFYNLTKDQCWTNCLNVKRCTGISFCSSRNNECYLYDNGVYGVLSNANYTTITTTFERKSFKELASVRPGEYIQIRHDPSYSFSSVKNCWINCSSDKECVAISFCETCRNEVNCLLFRNIQSALINSNSSFISIAKSEEFFDFREDAQSILKNLSLDIGLLQQRIHHWSYFPLDHILIPIQS